MNQCYINIKHKSFNYIDKFFAIHGSHRNRKHIKCNRETCNYICHSDINNNGGTHCCKACKEKDTHGPMCQKLTYSMISSTNPVAKHSSASQS